MLADLDADRSRLADLNAQIPDLERSLAALQPKSELDFSIRFNLGSSLSKFRSERALVQERLVSYKYPVLSLPNEIVAEIFAQFVPVYPFCPPPSDPLSSTLLTFIFHKWRAIALASPVLWKALLLSADNIPDRPLRVSNALGRSGCCPLSMELNEFEHEGPDDSRGTEVLTAVVTHRARWEYLKLRLLQSSLPTIEGRLPLLRHLDLEFYYDSPGPIAFHNASASHGYPR